MSLPLPWMRTASTVKRGFVLEQTSLAPDETSKIRVERRTRETKQNTQSKMQRGSANSGKRKANMSARHFLCQCRWPRLLINMASLDVRAGLTNFYIGATRRGGEIASLAAASSARTLESGRWTCNNACIELSCMKRRKIWSENCRATASKFKTSLTLASIYEDQRSLVSSMYAWNKMKVGKKLTFYIYTISSYIVFLIFQRMIFLHFLLVIL